MSLLIRAHSSLVLALALSVATCVPVSAGQETGGERELFNDVAIKVNSENISMREVEALYNDSYVLIQDKLRRGELLAANLNEAIKLAWNEALETAIQDRVLDQRATARRKDIINSNVQRAGGVLGSEKVLEMFHRLENEELRKLEHVMVTAAGGEEELRKALKRRGQTFQEWREGLTKELWRRYVISLELGGGLNVRPSEVKEYFEKHPDQFGQAEAWRLRRIRIAKKNFTTPEIALQAAQKTKAAIEGGKDFAEIAAAVSDDAQFASAGGLMTRGGQSDLPSGAFPAEEKIAAKMKDGQLSDPLDGGDWYILIQRVGYQERRTKTFDEVSEKAEAIVYSERLKQKKKEMQERLKRTSYVEVLQKDPPAHLLPK
jgi:parvulin-like peptidyl-prolyl isomerase